MSGQSYLRYIIFFLKTVGLCKIKSDSATKNVLLRLWRYILNANIFYFTLSSLLYYKLEDVLDFQGVLITCFYFMTCLNLWVKLNYYCIFDGTCDEILKEITHLFRHETQTGIEDKTLAKILNFINKLSCFWIGICSAFALGDITAFVILNHKSERALPLELWYPFDWTISPYYELTIAYQLFTLITLSISSASTDMFFVSCVLLTRAQFEFLGWELKYLVQATLLKHGMNIAEVCRHFAIEENLPTELSNSEQSSVSKTIVDLLNSESVKVDLRKELTRLAKFHQALLKFCVLLEDFFSPLYLPFLLLTTISIIFLASSVTVKLDATVKITAGLGLMGMSVSLFLPCYFGQLLLSQSENLYDDMFASHWYMCDENFKTSFKILCCGASKPIRLTFGKFADLSLGMFLQVMKAVASYVIFIYQVAASSQK